MPPNPYNKLTVSILSDLLLARGLDNTGTKTAMLARLKKQDAEVEAAERASREAVEAASGAGGIANGSAGAGAEDRKRPRARAGMRGRATGGRDAEDGRGLRGGMGRSGEEKEVDYSKAVRGEGSGEERDVVRGLMEWGSGGVEGAGEDDIVVNETHAGGARGRVGGKANGNANGNVRNRRRGRGVARGRAPKLDQKTPNGDAQGAGATALEMAEWYLKMEKKRDEDRQKMRFLMGLASVVVGVLVLIAVLVVWLRASKET